MALGDNRPTAVDDGSVRGVSRVRYADEIAEYARQQREKYWADLMEQQRRAERVEQQNAWANMIQPDQTPEPEPEPEPIVQQPTPEPEEEPVVQPVVQTQQNTMENLVEPVATPSANEPAENKPAPGVPYAMPKPDVKTPTVTAPRDPAETYEFWRNYNEQQEEAEQEAENIQTAEQETGGYIAPIAQEGARYGGYPAYTGDRSPAFMERNGYRGREMMQQGYTTTPVTPAPAPTVQPQWSAADLVNMVQNPYQPSLADRIMSLGVPSASAESGSGTITSTYPKGTVDPVTGKVAYDSLWDALFNNDNHYSNTPIEITTRDVPTPAETRAEKNQTEYTPNNTPYVYGDQYLSDLSAGLIDESFAPDELAELYGGYKDNTKKSFRPETPITLPTVLDVAKNGIPADIQESIDKTPPATDEYGSLYDLLTGQPEGAPKYTEEDYNDYYGGEAVSGNDSYMMGDGSDLITNDLWLDPETTGRHNYFSELEGALNAELAKLGYASFEDMPRDEYQKLFLRVQKELNDSGVTQKSKINDVKVANKGIYDEYEKLGGGQGAVDAIIAANDAELSLGTPERERFLENFMADIPGPEVYAQPRRTQDLADNLVEQFGYSPERAMQMAENPEGWNFETGRPKMQGNGSPRMSWEDTIGRDRFMDDLMLMNAPGFDENGNPNTAAQALFSDNISTEDKLHLFDKGGNFFSPNSGVNISEAFANLVANDPAHASGTNNPNLKQMIYTTEEEFAKMFSDFLDANPLIASMYDAGILTLDDIKNNFFKEVNFGSGAGSPKPYYSGGYGYSGGGGGGYGYPYGGGSKSSKANTWINQSQATVKKQQEQRINNIMKNWSF